MARTAAHSQPTIQKTLLCLRRSCLECLQGTQSGYIAHRVVSTLDGLQRLHVHVRCCENRGCPRYHHACRSEEEGFIVLPGHQFGLDVIALVGTLRYQQHRSVPEIHLDLRSRGVAICQRSVTNLLDRYDELLALRLSDSKHLQSITARQKRVILAIDGLQPDVGHEVLWVLRDCLSGQVLLARSLLSSTEQDLAVLIEQVKRDLKVPIVGVISDGQRSIRNAVAAALKGVPHQLCHFHYLREAALPIYEADRHAKKELKKAVRGIRPIERVVEGREDAEAQVIVGYCSAVRSAVTDDGRPPLQASGVKLVTRMEAISTSLAAVEEKRGFPKNCRS
jgi:hypothetical protein